MEAKKNIALFMGILENNYSNSVLKGALMGAKECDANLIVFPMDLIDAQYAVPELNAYRYQYNTLSSHMANDSIDGIVIEYGSITSCINQDRKKAFLEQIGNKPVVLIAEKAEGFASVSMDNETGLKEIIEHLIKDHGYSKIGFMSGPKGNIDADIRKDVYIDTLKKHNLFLGDDWIAYGDFSEYIFKQLEALYTLHPDMEALVCANDNMAIGAINYFAEKGLETGKDIFVTGFDNLPAGFLMNPSLTTVKADPHELSRRAVHELFDKHLKPDNTIINTKMIRRQSCGCCEFDVKDDFRNMMGISDDWREMAKYQMSENDIRHSLERELGNVTRELVFALDNNKARCKAILDMMHRFKFDNCSLFLYDEFIKHKKGDEWTNPESVCLVGYYDEGEDAVFEKGEVTVLVNEIFNWRLIRNGNRHEVIVLPLFYGEMQIGFLLAESDVKSYLYAYDIAGQISSIFYTIDILERQARLKKALEDANQSKSHFLANMSHEIRTPINAIIGFNEMIIRENNDENIAEYANDVKNAADNLLLLVNDTLDFSKIEAGKMELILSEYKLFDLLKSVIGMMTSRAEAKGLALFLEYDENLPSVLEGDSGRIQQILINLLSNAIKYTERGKVTLKVKGYNQDNNTILNFSVSDTGIGIKEADIDKLFNLFERIEEKRNRHIEGTGLGINIVSGLLKLMGSELKVSSQYGVGSEFSFDVQQKIISSVSIGDELKKGISKVESRQSMVTFTAPDAKVLVVDDNFLNRKVIKSLLKDTLIEVELAKSGNECIEMAGKTKYDIILLDHMMPEMDGIETFEILINEKIVNISDTPIIALTANAIQGAREEYLEKGFTNYLAKPVLPNDLYEMLLKYLSRDKVILKD